MCLNTTFRSRISIKSLAGTLTSLLVTPETTGLAVKTQVHRENPEFAVRRQVLFNMKSDDESIGARVLDDDKTLDSVGIGTEGDELDVLLKEVGTATFRSVVFNLLFLSILDFLSFMMN